MKILITGGHGFVGNFIFNFLKDTHEVYRFFSKDIDLRNIDQVKTLFNDINYDLVIHCALSGREELFSQDPKFLSDGLLMFRNLWHYKSHYRKFINLGTAYEYDLNLDNTLINEGDFVNHLPTTSYGFAKNIIARIISTTENFYNLRIFGNFHETENSKRFFKKVIFEKEITIHNDQYIDYIYMPDILPMIEFILNNDCIENDINLVYNSKYKLSEMAYMLCDIMNLNKNKIKILSNNGKNLTGNGLKFSTYNFKLIGLEKGLGNYK